MVLTAAHTLGNKDSFIEVNRVGLSNTEQTVTVLHNLSPFHALPELVYTCICPSPTLKGG